MRFSCVGFPLPHTSQKRKIASSTPWRPKRTVILQVATAAPCQSKRLFFTSTRSTKQLGTRHYQCLVSKIKSICLVLIFSLVSSSSIINFPFLFILFFFFFSFLYLPPPPGQQRRRKQPPDSPRSRSKTSNFIQVFGFCLPSTKNFSSVAAVFFPFYECFFCLVRCTFTSEKHFPVFSIFWFEYFRCRVLIKLWD